MLRGVPSHAARRAQRGERLAPRLRSTATRVDRKWLIDNHLKIRHSFKMSEVSADQWQTEGQRGRRDPDVIIPDVRTRCLEFASNA